MYAQNTNVLWIVMECQNAHTLSPCDGEAEPDLGDQNP